MSTEIVYDCPRCPAREITFDIMGSNRLARLDHGWVRYYELFAVCRNCHKASVLVVAQSEYDDAESLEKKGPFAFGDSLNNHFRIQSYISLKDRAATPPPDFVPDHIAVAFTEGASCIAVNCWNAAGAMFRKCVDLATRSKLPPEPAEGAEDLPGLTKKVRRDLGLRLPWLFENRLLPEDLRELAGAIHQDGNDAAHAEFLQEPDARDLLDFTTALLERLYTEPEKLKLAKQRRDERRALPKV